MVELLSTFTEYYNNFNNLFTYFFLILLQKEDRASLEQFTHHDRRVEHLENNTYDTRTQDFGKTTIEEITEPTTITNSKKGSRQDTNDKNTRREEKISEVKRQKTEERREKMERREDKKTIRQSSVKSLTEKYIKSASKSPLPR